MNETKQSQFKKRAVALALASCLSLAPCFAEAAGLGKLTVLSGLGQPLRAELDIGATKDEAAGMTARLAPQDAFRQAGVDYAAVLLDLRFAVEKRPNGQSVVKVTSSKPVNEPFLDFLVELNWPAGRLVREYTFLLDPPEIAAKQSAAPVAEARVVETVRGGGAAQDRPMPMKSVARVPAVPTKSADPAGAHVVQPGETLRKIAAENKYDGVSLEQMLVGYFQKNPDAFIGDNVNRLKSGAILNLPDRAAVEAVTPAEAKKVYVAQSGDWNAYRQKLASVASKGPAKSDDASQSSAGKITAKVEEKALPAEKGKDQVKVSRTEMAAAGSAAGKAAGAAEADLIAREKALKEAQDRLAMLEKNVAELQKLVEMKNQKLAELQQQTAAKAVEVAKPVEPPMPAETPKLVEQPKPVEPEKAPEQKPPAPVVPSVESAKPVEPPKPVEAPKPPEPKPVPPKPPVPPPAPEPEPSLFDDPVPLIGGASILALLAGLFLYKRRRVANASLETTAAPGPSSLGPNSVFRMTGGQSVDTGNTPPQTGDFSQTGPGTIDTDEVDPVAEADVYMAYGRDTQAEEILLEALQKDPQRTAIHAKLLEIYANRRSLKQFETLASELYAQTGGVGTEWQKVATLGAGLDPKNPLYSGGVAEPSFDADATMIVTPGNFNKATQVMPGELAQMSAAVAAPVAAAASLLGNDTLIMPDAAPLAAVEAVPTAMDDTSADTMSLDFDLGIPAEQDSPEPIAEPPIDAGFATIDAVEADALDFDLGGDAAMDATIVESVGELHIADEGTADAIDFDLDALVVPAAEEASVPDFSPEGTLVMPSGMDLGQPLENFAGLDSLPGTMALNDDLPVVDFDLDVGSPATQTSVNPVTENPSLDMPSDFDQIAEFDDPQLSSTVVKPVAADSDSLDFDVKLTDSVFLGQPMMQPDFDISSINLDLAAEPLDLEPSVRTPAPEAGPAETARAEPAAEDAPESAPTVESNWEEVNTKLDLAKAYEEMGDLEGARELLQEVVGEGPMDLVEQAKSILARIGE